MDSRLYLLDDLQVLQHRVRRHRSLQYPRYSRRILEGQADRCCPLISSCRHWVTLRGVY